jgi:hypothetical protein
MKKIILLFFFISVVTLNLIAQMSVKITTQNINSCTQQNGAIYTKVENGAPPYTFQWSNGSNNAYIENLAAGTYCLTVTDAYCCAASGCIEVKSIPTLSLSVSIKNATACDLLMEVLQSIAFQEEERCP